MSPEQRRREMVDFRSDVDSLGATYFALLTRFVARSRADLGLLPYVEDLL